MKTFRRIVLVLITYIYLQTINAIETSSNYTIKRKGIVNYLFCNVSSFENPEFVDLLYKLSIPPNYEHEGLQSLTPEIYGALPLTQNQIIYYLSNLQDSSLHNAKNALTVTPFHYSSSYDREKPLPTFQYNTSGFSIDISGYSTFFIPKIALSYCYTDTNWKRQKNTSTTQTIYLYPSLGYSNENLFCNAIVLGGYTFHHVKRVMQTTTHPSVYSSPHSWELASTLCGGYIYSTNYLTFIPHLSFTQTNVFQSSIKENNYEALKAASKNFRYLNMSFSLKIKPYIKECYSYIAPSIHFGWRSIRQLSDTNFIAKLGKIIDRSSYFITETYSGNLNLFFVEGALGLSHRTNQYIELSYRTEFDKKVIASGLSAQIIWEF